MSADLDREIDRAVRDMLDVEPPAGFRARVMRRIEEPAASAHVASAHVASAHVASAFRRKFLWLALPVAAAAAIVIAVLVARRAAPAPDLAPTASSTIVKGTPDAQPPASTQGPTPGKPRTVTGENRQPAVAPPREAQRVAATAIDESAPAEGFPQVPSLSVPALTMPEIRGVPPAAAPTQIGVDPIAAPASIEIEPLPLSPRERQNQE